MSSSSFSRIRPLALVLTAGFISGHFTGNLQAAETTGVAPRVFCDDPQTLAASKSALAAGDATLRPALNSLLAEADKMLGRKSPSVMDKPHVPPSGDKHDYLSQAIYYWPDTNSPGGPYISRDGVRNPEADRNSDAGNFANLCYDSHTLALAYYFSGDEKYARQASVFIHTWFLDPATRMNPNLNYGQGIPGGVEGRPAGLISARCLADLVDAIGLLAGSKNWSTNDQQQMTAWAGDYFQWLTTSKIGLGEDAALNNHGTFYDVQAVSLALFLGKTDFAREKVLAARQSRIAHQIEPDGRMPRELTRTLSFQYSMFNLQAEMQLASEARSVGVDLWHYQTADGRSIQRAAEFMSRFADPASKWPYQQIQRPNRRELDGLLLRAAVEFPGSEIKDALKYIRTEDFAGDLDRLHLRVAPLPSENKKLTAKADETTHGE